MDRTVPSSGNEEINLYLRTYYSLLRSSREVQIKTLLEAHKRIHSALHVRAESQDPDMAAFIYSVLRMPECLGRLNLVVMGQSEQGFAKIESFVPDEPPELKERKFGEYRTTAVWWNKPTNSNTS